MDSSSSARETNPVRPLARRVFPLFFWPQPPFPFAMAMYSTDDELARPGSANGISFGSPGGVLFFGNQTHLSTPSPSPNSTLLMSPAGNSANGKDNVPVAAGDQQILQHLYECFLSGAYSDLLLRFHGEQVSEFHVHKLIVCRSPMIQQMLQTNPM